MLSRSVPRFLLEAAFLVAAAAVAAPTHLDAVEIADISGELSKDFDPFVREAFPELIA